MDSSNENIIQTQQQLNQQQKQISYQLVNEIKQEKRCGAIAFNKEGTIMAAADEFQIKIWELENGILKSTANVLKGHTSIIFWLVFSKKQNWFASGSGDRTIRCWKEITKNNWVSTRSLLQIYVSCLLLNRDEDQLISGCFEYLSSPIQIWGVDCSKNILNYRYSLEKHTDKVQQISLNSAETSLVSCSRDKSIIIWRKGMKDIWEFNYYITKGADDYGFRISFMKDNMIAWQQYSQGITHIFELDNGIFKERPNLQIALNQSDIDYQQFPSVYNNQKNILIQKHNKYVYIIQQQNTGQFKIESEPIDCTDSQNFGGLTNDGKYLVIWNSIKKLLKVYQINYE